MTNRLLTLASVSLLVLLSPFAADAGFFDNIKSDMKESWSAVERDFKDKVDGWTGDAEQEAKDQSKQIQDDVVPGATDVPRYDAEWVAETQRRLTSLGFDPGPIDGAFGKRTGDAIRAFQRQSNLTPDGKPRPSMMRALRARTQTVQTQPQAAPQTTYQAVPEATYQAVPQTKTNANTGGDWYSSQGQLPAGDLSGNPPSFGAGNNTVPTTVPGSTMTPQAQGAMTTPSWTGGMIAPPPGAGITAPAPMGAMVAPSPGGGMTAPAPMGAMVAPPPGGGMLAPAPSGATKVAPADGVASYHAAQPSPAAADAQAAGLRLLQGLPLVHSSGYQGTGTVMAMKREGILNDEQIAAVERYLDHVRIGLNPDLARAPTAAESQKSGAYSKDLRARCIANLLLTEAEKAVVMDPPDVLKLSDGLPIWKGQGRNEFEVQRARDTYNNELLPKLLARAPVLPGEFITVGVVRFGSYDPVNQAFAFRTPFHLGLPASTCRLPEDGDYLPVDNPIVERWQLPPDQAESIVRQIPVDGGHSFGSTVVRKVYTSVVFGLSAAPESPINSQGPPRTPMRLDVKRVALYEDPDLERQLHAFKLDNPAPAVMLAGVPDRVPVRETVILDAEAAVLLLLRDQGDVLSDAAWNNLARIHAFHDKLYYDKEAYSLSRESSRKKKLDGYDPDYIPFFPQGTGLSHNRQLTPGQLTTFKAWSLQRAAALGDRFVAQAQLQGVREAGRITGYRLLIGQPAKSNHHLSKLLTGQGIALELLAMPKFGGGSWTPDVKPEYLAAPDGKRSTMFRFANPLSEYVPAVTAEQLAPHYQGSRLLWPALVDVSVTDVKLVQVPSDERSYITREKETFVIGLSPSAVSIIASDGFTVAYREAYDTEALQAKAEQIRQAESDARSAELAAAEAAAAQQEAFRSQLDVADILGIRLGMTAGEAEAALRQKVDVGWVASLSPKPSGARQLAPVRPYAEFRTFISADGKQQVTLFYHPDTDGRLVGLTRNVLMPQAVKPEQVVSQLRKKYGPESLESNNRLTWSPDVSHRDRGPSSLKRTCVTQIGWGFRLDDLVRDDGAEFSWDERKQISARMARIIVSAGTKRGSKQRDTTWDSTTWRECGPTVHAHVQELNENLSLTVGLMDLGEYADTYNAWLQHVANNQPAVVIPEL